MADKFTKKEVNYGPSGRSPDKCRVCEHFIPARSRSETSSCKLVSGAIFPNDWCKEFKKKESRQ